MLIDYSIRSFEVLERKMNSAEKDEVFQVFNRLGVRMRLRGLPKTFVEWETMRHEHQEHNLQHSKYTDDLYNQYRKHLGPLRYRILLEAQKLVMPRKVHELLGFRKISLLSPLLTLYKASRSLKFDWLLKAIILPSKYKKEIKTLDNRAEAFQ
jgi:hypothetical protein